MGSKAVSGGTGKRRRVGGGRERRSAGRRGTMGSDISVTVKSSIWRGLYTKLGVPQRNYVEKYTNERQEQVIVIGESVHAAWVSLVTCPHLLCDLKLVAKRCWSRRSRLVMSVLINIAT